MTDEKQTHTPIDFQQDDDRLALEFDTISDLVVPEDDQERVKGGVRGRSNEERCIGTS